MPNANTPFGLRPLEYLSGAAYNGGARVYCIPNSDDTNVYAIGDAVTLAGSADAAGVATVTLATPGSGLVGAIIGFAGSAYGGAYVDPNANQLSVVPAVKSRDYYVLVADDPCIIFEVQEIGTGTQLDAAAVGLNANLVAGTNNGFVSGWLLTNTTEAGTSTLDCKLLGLVQRPAATNTFGQYAKWKVLINNHLYRGGVTGV
jgi:hypothetical protein